MHYKYFKLSKKLFRVSFDGEDIPDTCEIYNREIGAFESREDLLLDVTESFDSEVVPEEKFWSLVNT